MLIESALAHYYPQVQEALRELSGSHGPDEFAPGAELPELTPAVREYLSASELRHTRMGEYRGKKLTLLDLTRNPGTMTTKTFASLTIVARAVRYIQRTGERVTIVTPSSANKAVAMRDAVLRAINTGLVSADQLNVVVVVPAASVHKIRSSELLTDSHLARRNPIAVYRGEVAGDVKSIARRMMDNDGRALERDAKTNIWYTLQLENYLAADVVRSLAESEFFAPADDEPRLHVHSVSSAYGLLGHAYGRERFGGAGLPSRYFLVQHLGAPDMVISLYHDGDFDEGHRPDYSYEEESGRYVQHADPHFPAVTFDPRETLDPTFYTRNPVTSPRMNSLINSQGGGGVVVSLAECLERYGLVRSLLGAAGVRVPTNPTAVREWSLIMAVTGLLNGIDRGLVPENDIVVHGSGCYSVGDFDGVTLRDMHEVRADDDSLTNVVLSATAI
ncbi:DUF6002 family protein [Actinoplanes siamensis]|uniref:Uncharacterized protein n=1 Tax=Actinoplanes siamensis TaxID=1223317 RepID=A0A919KCC6_9ACTN|nr:DUF6002 family protein [Actinoplanes siamensis]GIF03121.1 hypothetical protein Asi03nite_06590 [Actinoplanes siamensis]